VQNGCEAAFGPFGNKRPTGRRRSSITELVHFDAQFGDIHLSPLQEINLVADPETIDEQLHSPPSAASWHIRDLYFGLEGAKAWLAVVNDPSYSPHDQERKLRQAIM
jgi:hypothetical protein